MHRLTSLKPKVLVFVERSSLISSAANLSFVKSIDKLVLFGVLSLQRSVWFMFCERTCDSQSDS